MSTTKSLPRPAASPISGRLARSRSPPQPKTVMTLAVSSIARDELARQRSQIPQGVVGMRVVDNDGEWLAAVDALESSRHMRERFDAAGNRLRVASARISMRRPRPGCCRHSRGRSAERKWRIFSCGVTMSNRVPRGVDVHILGMKVAALPAVRQHHRAALAAELGQLRAVFVVEVGDRGARARRCRSLRTARAWRRNIRPSSCDSRGDRA